jgi:hypothetical protein
MSAPSRSIRRVVEMSETYAAARRRLVKELGERGWKTKPSLKVPQAEKDGLKLFFHPQSVYLNEHSLFIDIRGLDVISLVTHVTVIQNVRSSWQP